MGLISVEAENFERVRCVSEVSENEVCKNGKREVFNKVVGTFKGEHRLKIKENAIPTTMPNRKIPVAMRQPLKDELEGLVKLKDITQVDEPTEWVSQSVITLKENGKVRLCLDPQELNKVLLREHYIMPTIDDILHDLRQSKVFTKADLSSGYWHIELDEYSSELTTSQTCFGRYKWLRLPFGLCVSAEIFLNRLSNLISDLEGVVCIADDIIIHGKNRKEHDIRINKFIRRCEKEGIALNKEKMGHKVPAVTFMGHKITEKGL